MNKPKNLTPLLTTYAQPLKWTLALILVYLSTVLFEAEHGRVVFDSEIVATVSTCLSCFLYLFVTFRLVKPRGVDDIQALILLVLLPDPPFAYVVWTKLVFILIILAFRWTSLERKMGLLAIALQILQLTIDLGSSTCRLPPYYHYLSDTPGTGILCSKTDDLHYLYKYPTENSKYKRYVLFRQVKLCPGVKLIRRLAWRTSDQENSARRDQDGSYTVFDDPALHR